MRKLALLLMLLTGLFLVGCDSPAENATEERVEDAGEAAGRSEDAAEQQGEAAKEGETMTAPATDTGTTVTQTTVTTT